MRVFIVNDFITLKLENGNTNIYVNGEFFRQCKFLLLNIPIDKISSLDEIESIDEAAERLDDSLHPIIHRDGTIQRIEKIPSETEFWGHCSNLQVWAENNYNTNLIHSNLAFPLLRKLTDVGDPLAKDVFKEEIAKRFNIDHKNVILFLLKNNYLEYLTKDEREVIFHKNSERVRALLEIIPEESGTSLFNNLNILRSLIKLGDINAKDLLKDQILKAFNSKDIHTLNIYQGNFFFDYFSEKELEAFFYKTNKDIRKIIDLALEKEQSALEIGFPLLILLFKISDPTAKEILKNGVKKWLFSGNNSTIELIIKKYIQPIMQFRIFKYKDQSVNQHYRLFNYTELMDIYKDNRCPLQLYNYFSEYIKKFNKIYHFTRELIVNRTAIQKKLYIPSEIEIADSDFFILFINGRRKAIKVTVRPIHNKNVKKIIINNSESSFEPIQKKIEELKLRLNLIYEGINHIQIETGLIKNIFEFYFLDSYAFTGDEIREMFTLISYDVKIRIENVKC